MNKQTFGDKVFGAINYCFMAVISFIMLYPFFYCVVLSFNDGLDAKSGGIYFWPRVFSLGNYKMVFRDPQIITAVGNSVLRTLIGTILAVFLTAMFSYAVSRPNLRFKRFYMTVGVITMYFGGGVIPFYLLIRNLGLLNNFLVYILPHLFGMYNAIIFISFFRTIPMSLEESAKIDGANDFIIFIKLILPLSTPVLAAIALFVGVGHWNSWLDTTLYANKDHLETLSHMLVRMINTANYYEHALTKVSASSRAMAELSGTTSTALQLATMVVAAFPITVAYPFLQKYFTKGIMIGSLKG